MKRIALGFAAVMMAVSMAYAAEPAKTMDTSLGKVWTDQNGMSLYTFDNDGKGATKSSCTGQCIEKWPPFLAAEGAASEGEWTLVDVVVKDGEPPKKMWAYEGWPLYLWYEDLKPGDTKGDGVGGVWHIAKAD